jgi:hypothetical protein
MLEQLRRRTKHTIQFVGSLEHPEACTALMYAFDLVDNRSYTAVAMEWNLRADSEFAQFVIGRGFLKPLSMDECPANGTVIYASKKLIAHAGKYLGEGRVRSKWGKGHLAEHDVMDVPETYGERVFFFRGLAADEGLNLFREYARTKGIPESWLETELDIDPV